MTTGLQMIRQKNLKYFCCSQLLGELLLNYLNKAFHMTSLNNTIIHMGWLWPSEMITHVKWLSENLKTYARKTFAK